MNNELNTNKEYKEYKNINNNKNHHTGGTPKKKAISIDGEVLSAKDIKALITREFIDELFETYDSEVDVSNMLNECIDTMAGKQIKDFENYVHGYMKNHKPGGKYQDKEFNDSDFDFL